MSGHRGADLLVDQIAGIAQDATGSFEVIEVGEITADLSLRVPSFDGLIPPSFYQGPDYLTQNDPITDKLGNPLPTGTGGGDNHTHPIPRPSWARPLAAGDHVLVAWARGGHDPYILFRIARL